MRGQHRLADSLKKKITKRGALVAATAALIVAGGTTVAVAAAGGWTNSGAYTANEGNTVYLCFNDQNSSHNYVEFRNAPNGCAGNPGYSEWKLSSPAGVNQAIKDYVANATKSSVQTATTAVTNWPETSGWATDAFTRTVTITRQGAVDATKCGAQATSCFFYTGVLSDMGTFVTVDGAAAPNGDGKTISGVNNGTMNGSAGFQFYASDTDIDTNRVPSTQNGKGAFGTTEWAEQFFKPGTHFGGVSLINYNWTYKADATCESWNDAINPGDDGQSEADGNIIGVSACTAPAAS